MYTKIAHFAKFEKSLQDCFQTYFGFMILIFQFHSCRISHTFFGRRNGVGLLSNGFELCQSFEKGIGSNTHQRMSVGALSQRNGRTGSGKMCKLLFRNAQI